MVLGLVALSAWLVIVAAPETRIGRYLKKHLVDRPALRLNRVRPGQAALIGSVAVAASLVVWAGGGDGVRIIGMALPDVTTWLASAELTAYLDAAVAAFIGWSALRSRGVPGTISRAAGGMRRTRARASRVRRSTPKGDNDNGRPSRRVA